MKILAIETSCDDTGVAILESARNDRIRLLANLVSLQTKIHAPWGGVVPTLAKREHQKNLVPLLEQAFKKAILLKISKSKNINPKQILNPKFQIINSILEREPELLKIIVPFLEKYQKPEIDYLAVTIGPGLEPALWVGVNFARALSFFWNIPIIPINHLEGHIASSFFQLKKNGGISNFQRKVAWQPRCFTQFPISKKIPNHLQATSYPPKADPPRVGKLSAQGGPASGGQAIFPALALVVSGGHTQLILIKKFGDYQVVGETRDDAAGEAFDKAAKMLGLGYPGGPAISRLAAKWKSRIPMTPPSLNLRRTRNDQINSKKQNTNYKIELPRPMLNSGDFDFSFSGLKTALLYRLQKMTQKEIKSLTPALGAEFQQAAVDVLVSKTIQAAKKFNAKTVMLGGGVAANEMLRQTLKGKIKKELPAAKFLSPAPEFCTDNAAMIGLAATQKIGQKNFKTENWQKLAAQANLRL